MFFGHTNENSGSRNHFLQTRLKLYFCYSVTMVLSGVPGEKSGVAQKESPRVFF